MKVFLVAYSHAYGLGAQVVVAEDETEARKMAYDAHSWQGYKIEEIDTTVKGVTEATED